MKYMTSFQLLKNYFKISLSQMKNQKNYMDQILFLQTRKKVYIITLLSSISGMN